MAIVRELLIKVGFLTDKQAVTQVNKSIAGFKTGFAIAASAAAYAFSKVASFFGDIATATLDADELARTLGVSLKELAALQQAAREFRIDPTQFSEALSTVDRLFKDFRSGANTTLADIARAQQFEIDRAGSSLKVFQQILNYIGQISSETERIRVAESIFGTKLAPKIADLSKNLEKFRENAIAFQEIGEQIENTLPAAREYEQAINSLTTSFGNFALSISQTVFPVFETIIRYLTLISELARNAFNLNGQGLVKSVNNFSGYLDPLFDKTGLNNISNFFKGLYGGDSLLNKLTGNGNSGMMVNPVVTNNIDVNVAPGTTEQQAEEMGESISQAVRDSIMKSWQEIQYNNPVVE